MPLASINVRKESGCLYVDFRYNGKRCREQTLLMDTQPNRLRLEKLGDKIERGIRDGSFKYADYFPESRRASIFCSNVRHGNQDASIAVAPTSKALVVTPLFVEFAELWFLESEPRWRKRYRDAMRDTLDKIILPLFQNKNLAEVDRAKLLGFRAEIAKRPGRASKLLSGKRINKLMSIVKSIVNEGCDRYGLNSPARGIKSLKQKRSEIVPFSLEEVEILINAVRPDYKSYLTVRLLTGLRTGEANGLQWSDIDFEKNTLKVDRTLSRDGDGETKTEDSRRIIPLVPQVREALLKQKLVARVDCLWVFHTGHGNPIDLVNFTNRVWNPLLRYLGLKLRPPYQMRHTAATLMLAAGENPEWVAAMLGHTTTEMLFRVYSRFIPNLTRNDGRAFTGLLNAGAAKNQEAEKATATEKLLYGLTQDEKNALLVELTRQLPIA